MGIEQCVCVLYVCVLYVCVRENWNVWNGHVIELNVLQTGEACFSADWFTVPKKKKKLFGEKTKIFWIISVDI